MKQAILLPAVTLMVSWLSLSTPLSCHHGATALLHVIEHAGHDHVHDDHPTARGQVVLLPARMALYLYGLSVNVATMSAGDESQSNARSTMASEDASDDLVTVRQIPDTALVVPILNPALYAGPIRYAAVPDPQPTNWMALGLDPPPRYTV